MMNHRTRVRHEIAGPVIFHLTTGAVPGRPRAT